MTTKEFYRKVQIHQAEIEATSPEGIWLTFTDPQYAGSCLFANPRVAAQCLAQGSHRRATEAELEKHRASQEATRQRYARLHRERHQQFVVQLDPRDFDIVAGPRKAGKGKPDAGE